MFIWSDCGLHLEAQITTSTAYYRVGFFRAIFQILLINIKKYIHDDDSVVIVVVAVAVDHNVVVFVIVVFDVVVGVKISIAQINEIKTIIRKKQATSLIKNGKRC